MSNKKEEITFEDKVLTIARNVITDKIAEGRWLTAKYGSVKIDPKFLQHIYESIDMENVKLLIKPKIEQHIADKVFNSLATEMANDVKKILSDSELRDRFRFFLRQEISSIEDSITK